MSDDDEKPLDPEAARGRHLYHIWAHLQAAELNALQAICQADVVEKERLENREKPRLLREHGVQDECVQDHVLDL